MKKFRLGKIMAVFAFIAMLPLQTFAAETEEVSVTCTPNEGKTEYTVDLHIPNASNEQIATVSLKLDVTPDPQNSSTGYSSMIEFSKEVTEKAKVYEYRSNNTLNIYIAGTKALFKDDTLRVGTVSMRNSAGEALVLDKEDGVKLSSAENSLLVVRGFGRAESPNRDTSWQAEDPGGDEKPPVDPGEEIPPKPGEEEDGEKPDEETDEPDVPGVPGGSGGNNTAEDQYDNNRKVNGSRVQGFKTGDTNSIVIYVFSIAACAGVISAVAYRKRKIR